MKTACLLSCFKKYLWLKKPIIASVCKVLFFLIFLLSTSQLFAQQTKTNSAPVSPKSSYSYTYKIISSVSNTYGYDIYANGALRIHQPFVPATQGNTGFATKQAAEKIARLAISKMERGQALPTISREEMKKLKAL